MKLSRLCLYFLCTILAACTSHRHEGVDTSRAMVVKDKAFRQYLEAYGYAVRVGNGPLNRRLMTPTAVGSQIGVMNCYRRGIASLEGIGMFPQLYELVCSENPIEWLDLTGLPNLQSLTAMEVPLQHIDLTACQQLHTVELSEHRLNTLEVSHNTELTTLMCIFNDAITDIDLSHNNKLHTLYIRATGIRVLNLSHNSTMERVLATDTPLDTVWLSPKQDISKLEVWVDDTIAILKKE